MHRRHRPKPTTTAPREKPSHEVLSRQRKRDDREYRRLRELYLSTPIDNADQEF